jgi:hypothetical protein
MLSNTLKLKRRIVRQIPISLDYDSSCNFWHMYMQLRSGWRQVL